MNTFLSTYLNILRILGAMGVLLFHGTFRFFSNETLDSPFLNINLGHKCVIIFFVLSGYVIAYTTHNRNSNFNQYFINRSIRVYSVIIPALVFTFLIDSFGLYMNPEAYASHINHTGNYYIRYIIALLNLQQNWGLASLVSTNLPFWSIAYEYWYYIIFGVYYFTPNKYLKVTYVLLIFLFIGYKIIILMPVWLIGVGIYYLQLKISKELDQKYILSIFIVSSIIMVLYIFNVLPVPFYEYFPNGKYPMFFSSDFLNDYYLGVIFGVNIFLASQIRMNNIPKIISSSSAYMANGTFTLYLFHYPILVFLSIFLPYNHDSLPEVLLILLLIAASLIVIGNPIENLRYFFKRKISI